MTKPLSHAVFLDGVLNFVQFIPVLVLAPWAGSAADRLDRRRLLLATQLGATALSGSLALLAWRGAAGAWTVIAFALGLGVMSAFSAPASQALIASLVSPAALPSAVAFNSMTFNLARALGPPLATVAVKTLGIAAAFAINAGSYLALVAALLVVHPRPQRLASRAEARFRESFHLLRRQPELLAFLLIVAAVGFASDPVNTETPALARAFGIPAKEGGYLTGLFGAGAVTAAVLVAGRVAGSRRRMMLTMGLLGGSMLAFAATPWLPLGFVLLFLAGFGYLSSNTSATSRLQLGVDETQRGRIMTLWSIAFLGLRPFASLLDGVISRSIGVRWAAAVLALPVLAGVVAASSYRKLKDR